MFGSEYSKHPEILMNSFREMKHEHKRKNKNSKLILLFGVLYLRFFGIPEIGFQARSLYFKKILLQKKLKIKNALDAGSGIGTYSFLLSRTFPEAKITAVEIDNNKLNFSKKFARELNVENINFIYQDISKKIKNREKYDLIINIDVLEHIKNYKTALNNFYEQLLPGGYLYIHTPQSNQRRIFKQLKNWHHEDHVREGFIPEELKKDLKKLGFKIVKIRETFGFFGKLAWEINHIALNKGFILAGIIYPIIYPLLFLDELTTIKHGLGIAILAKKITH